MSRSDRFRWPKRTAKKPPPEHGIRVKQAGSTWWGQQWMSALVVVLSGDSGRLARGRTYARAGRVHDLAIHGGKVTARVTGSRATPYKIEIELAELSESTWKRAIDGLASKSQFSAELLAGKMPEAIDEVFVAAGSSLFPREREELKTSCSCPDWGDPCKHVAATHSVLGDAFDRDPFLLFELRGRTKDQILDALRAARAGTVAGEIQERVKRMQSKPIERAAIATVELGSITEAEYDQPRGTLPALRTRFDAPVLSSILLKQLGAPRSWNCAATPAELLASAVRAAAETARALAMADVQDPIDSLATETARGTATRTQQAGNNSSGAKYK
ncbi:MAG: SWIM zinc finger family protein [Planctomycetes bacterium]|nr:SWIM zinc finger family protein [Planctomycetota bacterium]